MRVIRAIWSEQAGATSIEYALIAGFVSLAVIVGATAIGTKLNSHYFSPALGSKHTKPRLFLVCCFC